MQLEAPLLFDLLQHLVTHRHICAHLYVVYAYKWMDGWVDGWHVVWYVCMCMLYDNDVPIPSLMSFDLTFLRPKIGSLVISLTQVS
jgi:hypothetical protein